MNNELNVELFFNNLSFLLKKTGKKVGELEAAAGVSTGYISRKAKDRKKKLNVELIVKASEILGVSIDTLLKIDLATITPTTQYLISFLEKLIHDTQADKLDWNRQTAEYLNTRINWDEDYDCDHPLFTFEHYTEENNNGGTADYHRPVFVSHLFDVHTRVAGDCFQLRMKNGTLLFLMDIQKSGPSENGYHETAYEIWMCPEQGTKQFLCCNCDNGMIAILINNLHDAITDTISHPRVRDDIRYVIDSFMRDDLSDDDKDDVPF